MLSSSLSAQVEEAKDESFRYQVRTVTQDFRSPMGFEIAPDKSIYLIELEGDVTRIDPDTGERTNIAKIPVFSKHENGLLGIALDPDFEKNQYVYLLFSPEDYVGQRISRFKLSADKLQEEKTILEWPTQRRECCHHGGMLQFGPDRILFATGGDNTHPNGDSRKYAPIDRRKGREVWNAEKSSSNPNDLRGGIIRIQVLLDGSYKIPEGNLFKPGTPGTRPEIYIMGCRNPWKMSVDQETGYLYWGEVGPDARKDGKQGPMGYDEINQARAAGNYGWPYFIADNKPYAEVDFETGKIGSKFDPKAPVNNSPLNTGEKNLPPAQPAFIYYPYGDSPEWPILGKGGRTACAGPVFRYDPSFEKTGGFPKQFDNCLLFWDWHRTFVKWARLKPNQDLDQIEDFPFDIPLRRPSDARFGKDGTLWFIDFGSSWKANKNAKLIHVTYQRGNVPPVAKMKVNKKNGSLPLTIELDASESKDGEGKPLEYRWSIGEKVLSTKAQDKITLTEAGDMKLTLLITDAEGATDSLTHDLVVGNSPPRVALSVAGGNGFYEKGSSLKYQLSAEDKEQKEILKNGLPPIITLAASQEENPGLAAMRASDCFSCHHTTKKLVGPPFIEIAKAYNGKKGAVEVSAQRIINGSAEVWGTTPMMAHPHVNVQDAEAMARYIFSLDGTVAPQITRSSEGVFEIPEEASGVMELSATLTDSGFQSASALSGSTSLRLYPRVIPLVLSDEVKDCKILTREAPEKGQFIGSIRHGSRLKLNKIFLSGQKTMSISYASGGAGATLTLEDSNKQILGTLQLAPTGGWDQWKTAKVALRNISDQQVDLNLRFSDSEKRKGLVNVDWISFGRE